MPLIPVVFQATAVLATLSNPGHIVIYAPGEFSSLPPCCDSKSLGYYHWFDKSSGTKKAGIPAFFSSQ
ncbi:hypothetical protein DKG82_24395 [Salmonella enterica subsp. enterica serovar Lexington]|uniref:Uncharacterized protein n=1 Tax=Salmonella enterica subsp. enterica serovar Mikawasima TaxID=149388 RepID=A0A5W4U4Z9_SALET|nr:hypothetical protein [Salmonella enterica subsp. enterica serovar Lexington]EAA1178241.1 hypothetical protein [Salmonella enterica subsp. enterica serovar Mikawasima]EAA2727813.1 hypothetical protein [Salmonella enterica subsp. enterica serovar Idikan]EAA2979831.1 hypothetical protein [Salmonella enterica subsp. enterica serovar Mbao]EAA7890162.1 hypothetical protein [Salmonella enterica]EAA9124021.1 hypothetical protein [Salmonella enterica subsp. enterica serovar Maastricht]EAB9064062.1 